MALKLSTIHNIIVGDNRKNRVMLIYAIALINIIIIFLLCPPALTIDSQSYLCNDVCSSKMIDLLRTPIYPLFCNICNYWFAETIALRVIVAGQAILFLLSIYAFYVICESVTQNRSFIFYTTIAYAVMPHITLWTMHILSESFSISLAVMCTYCMVKIYNTHKLRYVAGYVVMLSLMILTRPNFIYYIVASILVFTALAIMYNKRIFYLALAVTVIPVCVLAGYNQMYKQQYGIYASSTVQYMNEYYILREAGAIAPTSDNAAMNQDIQYYIEHQDYDCTQSYRTEYHKEFYELCTKYGFPKVTSYVINTIKSKPLSYLKETYVTIATFFDKIVFEAWESANNGSAVSIIFCLILDAVGDLINIEFCTLYLLLVAYLVYFIIAIKRKHKFSIVLFVAWTLTSANLAMVIFSAQSSWGRLLAQSYPMIYILLSFAILSCFHKIKRCRG